MTQEILSQKIENIERASVRIKLFTLIGLISITASGAAWWVTRDDQAKADKVEIINQFNLRFQQLDYQIRQLQYQRRNDSIINSGHLNTIEQKIEEISPIMKPKFFNSIVQEKRKTPNGPIEFVYKNP